MSVLALNLILAFAAPEISYTDAYQQMEHSGRPLLVLVGADWCPGCRAMKGTTVPELKRAGQLEGVIFAQVNTDKEPELAKRLMKGGTIPQLILYTQNAEGWRRNQITGAQNVNEVRAFLEREIASHQAKPGATTRASK